MPRLRRRGRHAEQIAEGYGGRNEWRECSNNSIDYCVLTSDDGGHEADPNVLVVHDDKTQAMWALAVRAKGSAPEVAAWVEQ